MKAKKYLSIINIILGLALVLTPFVLFPVCSMPKPDGTPMGCYYSGIFITSMGVLVVVFSLLAFFLKFPAISLLFSLTASIMCWLVPNRIVELSGHGWACSLCGNPDHACRASTMPVVGGLVIAITIMCVIGLVMNFVSMDSR